MKILERRVEVYRLDSEEEADDLILAAEKVGDVTKKIIEFKTKKSKGEIVDSWYKFTLQVDFEDTTPCQIADDGDE